ncbi:Filament-like plant protein 7 [Striga hermonthica]|uniref:Filament-like plant protein 7 n=1 Tax=Striga hermonthica TaxID=68872 RepID=A0A9N7NM43_STRHE|nr:Filament-like plant protein 7 [Striga hermonthica]
MDQKSWLWKKRSTEKTLIADKASHSSRKCEEETTEVQKIMTEKIDLERELQMLNEKLSSAHAECEAKDNVAKKQLKISEEAVSGWEKAENEAKTVKEELEKVSQQKFASEERMNQLDAALKECMQQLRFVRDEQDKRIQNAVMKTTKEFEKTKVVADEKLAEVVKKLFKSEAENSQLIKVLTVREKTIEDLTNYKTQLDANFNALSSRVESTEKENARLKYEIHVLEKELDIRNEERELNCRRSEHLQGLFKDQKIAERCERSRLLMENSTTSLSDMAESDDRASYAESWASALNTELEHFKNDKQLKIPCRKSIRTSDIDLMDDFAEMEKLALASADVIQTSKNLISCEATNGSSVLNSHKLQPNASETINKILELLEGVNEKCRDNGVGGLFDSRSCKNLENPTGYTVRVFQWKSDELSFILQKFVRTCNGLLNGSVNLECFVQEVALTLEWVLNHCFSIQDVSSMKDAILSRFDWDECTVDSGWANPAVECSKLPVLGQGVECVKCESEVVTGSLRSEVEAVRQRDGNNRDEIGKRSMMKEDVETLVIETNDELRKAYQRILDLENELENKSSSCIRLEETCRDLQKQLQSKEVLGNERQMEEQLQSDWEITSASEKLAECQETILNLGKQLKALASPNDAALFDKIHISTPSDSVVDRSSTPRKNISRRPSCLLDKMLAENNLPTSALAENKNCIQNGNGESGVSSENLNKMVNGDGIIKHSRRSENATAVLDVVPCEKNGGRGFMKKIFWRQKKSNGSKITLLIGCS